MSKTYTVSEAATVIGVPDTQIVATFPKCGIRFTARRSQRLQQAEINSIRRHLGK